MDDTLRYTPNQDLHIAKLPLQQTRLDNDQVAQSTNKCAFSNIMRFYVELQLFLVVPNYLNFNYYLFSIQRKSKLLTLVYCFLLWKIVPCRCQFLNIIHFTVRLSVFRTLFSLYKPFFFNPFIQYLYRCAFLRLFYALCIQVKIE